MANNSKAHTTNCASTNTHAFLRLNCPLVKGRKRVRSTRWSKSLSKISLKQQPTPRINNATSEKTDSRHKVGKPSSAWTNAALVGNNVSHVPTGRSKRHSLA